MGRNVTHESMQTSCRQLSGMHEKHIAHLFTIADESHKAREVRQRCASAAWFRLALRGWVRVKWGPRPLVPDADSGGTPPPRPLLR